MTPGEVTASWSALLAACDVCVETGGAARQALRLRLQAAKKAGAPSREAAHKAEALYTAAWSLASIGDRVAAAPVVINLLRKACDGLRPFLPEAHAHAVRTRADIDG